MLIEVLLLKRTHVVVLPEAFDELYVFAVALDVLVNVAAVDALDL